MWVWWSFTFLRFSCNGGVYCSILLGVCVRMRAVFAQVSSDTFEKLPWDESVRCIKFDTYTYILCCWCVNANKLCRPYTASSVSLWILCDLSEKTTSECHNIGKYMWVLFLVNVLLCIWHIEYAFARSLAHSGARTRCSIFYSVALFVRWLFRSFARINSVS